MKHNILFYLFLIPWLAFLDCWGGGGFEIISARIPDLLKRGWLPARRYGIPATLFLLYPSPTNLFACSTLSFILHFAIDDLSRREWEYQFLFSLSLFLLLFPTCSYFAILPAAWWLLGRYLSNVGIKGRKLDWFYVELLRGAFIAIGVLLNGIL